MSSKEYYYGGCGAKVSNLDLTPVEKMLDNMVKHIEYKLNYPTLAKGIGSKLREDREVYSQ